MPDQPPDSGSPRIGALRRLRRSALRLTVLGLVAILIMKLTGCMERLYYMPFGAPPPAPAGAEDVYFNAPDGTRLHGWFAPARGTPRGTILAVHGNAGNVESHWGFVSFLPDAGFNLLLFDYRGYGHSDAGRLRREHLRSDTEAALDYLLQRPEAKDSQVGIYAQSLGATFGLAVAADRPEVRSIVIVSAFTTWREAAAAALGGGEPGPLSRFASRLIPQGMDPIDLIPNLGDRPVLIIHGRRDEIIPVAQGEALAAAGNPGCITLRTPDNADHNSIDILDPEFRTSIVEFLTWALATP